MGGRSGLSLRNMMGGRYQQTAAPVAQPQPMQPYIARATVPQASMAPTQSFVAGSYAPFSHGGSIDPVHLARQIVHERARGGGARRLLIDHYPTHYLPHVGRQVMADGGMPIDPPQPAPQRIADIIRRGQPLAPQTPDPTPEERQAAMADTRVGGDIVAKRLNTIVPERDRVAGGQYTPGAPGGGRWADLPPEVLNKKGVGFKVTDDELHKLWQDSVEQSSAAAKNAVAEHKVKPLFLAKDWDKAMRLPLRDHLWYELSGEKMAENMPDLQPHEFMHLMDLIGATSARAKPGENLERSLATLSQHLRGVPVDVDLTIPETVRQALSRTGTESSALPGNKTGYFSDTLALTGGVPTRFPISVNDVWVGKMFGVPDDVMSSNQSLHEPMAIYFNKIRDLYNERHGHEVPFPYQSWNFQAPAWVHLRGEEAGEKSGDAYHQVWGGIINKLNKANIPGLSGDQISRDALMHPGFADALRRTTKPFREATKATVEMGTQQTDVGRRAHDLYKRAIDLGDEKSQGEYLKALTTAMYASARGKGHPWERLKKAITGDLGVGSDITRISHPTSESPLDVGGSFEGAISPNIRIPLKDMSDAQIEMFNAIAGKHLRQDAMASSRILDADDKSAPRAGHVRGYSAFVPTTEGMDPSDIRKFGEALDKEGHTFSYVRYPNGYRFDVNPRFDDSGVTGISEDKLADVYDAVLKGKYGDPKLLAHDYSSVYTESSDYSRIRSKLIKEMKDEFVAEARKNGVDADTARSAFKAETLPDAITGRSKKAWDRYRARLDHLAAAEAGFKGLAKRVNDAHADFIDRATKRQQRMTKAEGGEVSEDRHPALSIPGIHIVTAEAGEPVFDYEDERYG